MESEFLQRETIGAGGCPKEEPELQPQPVIPEAAMRGRLLPSTSCMTGRVIYYLRSQSSH